MRNLPRFNYFKPESFEEAIEILKEHEGRICPFAGGTDLFASMKEKGLICANVLDLKGIKDYDFIREANGTIEIGALASIRSMEVSALIGKEIPFLSEAAGRLGSVQVRNRATIGGNLCNASPSAEMAPSLMCLEASVEIVDEKGVRVIPLENFFVGPGETALRGVGLMRKIIIPLLPQNSAGTYFKHSPRRAMDLAVVSVGCVLHFDRDKKKCMDSRIVLGAVAPTPLRAGKAEAVLNGREIREEEIEKAGKIASREAVPITDVRGSAEYRTEMVNLIVKRNIREVLRIIRS